MNRTRLGLLAATAFAGCFMLSAPAPAQAPAHVPTERPRAVIGPPHDVVWQQGPDRPPAGKRQPNIILIVADDLGYNDLTFAGAGAGVAGGTVSTSHIDSIGHEGVSFDQGYTGHGTCAPSRAALMTGRYPTRFGFEFTPVPLAFARSVRAFNYGIRNPVYFADREKDIIPTSEMGVPTSEIMLAKLLQDAGYHTLQFGKWHLGESPQFQPQNRGFSESLGFTPGASMFLPPGDPRGVEARQTFDPIDISLWNRLQFYVRKDGGEAFAPKRYMTDYLTDEAINAIEANRNRPFFMYMAYNAPHTPLQATKEDFEALSHIENRRLRIYAAMIRSLDRNVGRLLQAVQEQGLEKDTIVIFTSDNGGAYYLGLPEINQPFRGWKQTFFEGGIRTPYFIRWPGHIPAGATYRAPVSHFDLFATAAAAAGAKLPGDRVYDGVDLVPFVRGEKLGRPHEVLFWRTGPYQVVRAGDWKLQVTERPDKDWLFDLSVDPTERNNLAQAHPEKVAELKALIAKHNAQQAKPLWPELGQTAVMLDHTLETPQAESDEYVYWGN
ncbi:MAG: sulfatase-like hydrolase/transferase [Caulobacteraceae bacterium]|nr:sulfatase-like hydrolase/transferase [Caulobacteraceae bacterium]